MNPVSRVSRLEKTFWPRGERRDVWMILDSARDRRIYPFLLGCHLNYFCLYSGVLSPSMEAAAPYLVQLEHDERETRRLVQLAWGNSWGIFLRCDRSMTALRRHLRGFLIVRDISGSRLVFRYYDPRVLRVYLPGCTQEELRTFFGPVERFWIEGENSSSLLCHTLERGVNRQSVDLDTPKQEAFEQHKPGPDLQGTLLREHANHAYPILIRNEQLTLFARKQAQAFEDWMANHIKMFFPSRYKDEGETAIRKLIQYGVEQALAYGFRSKRDCCKYIDLMVLLGREFDTDGRLSWAAQILQRDLPTDTRMRVLVHTAQAQIRKMHATCS